MVYTKDYKFPNDEELTVDEIKVGAPTLHATGQLLGRACDELSKVSWRKMSSSIIVIISKQYHSCSFSYT